LFDSLCKDKRFIVLGERDYIRKTQFLPKKVYLEKLFTIIFKVSGRKSSEIRRYKFFKLISELFKYSLNLKDKNTIITWSNRCGLLSTDSKNNIVISTVNLFGFIENKFRASLFKIFIESVGYNPESKKSKDTVKKLINIFITNFIKNRCSRKIIKMRYGLTDGTTFTQKQVSDKTGISSRRVGQIERKTISNLVYKDARFSDDKKYRQLSLGTEISCEDKVYILLVKIFLNIIVETEGTRIFLEKDLLQFKQIKFVLKLMNIPIQKLKNHNVFILGINENILKQIEVLFKKRKYLDFESIIKYLTNIGGLNLSESDVRKIASIIFNSLQNTTTNIEVVYAALKKIDRPAHYSEIAKTCNKIFPDRFFTPKIIFSSLSKSSKKYKLPWVWTGLRGIYALKEWGYRKPDKDLYSTVFKIIESSYKKTKRPVSINTIFIKISKFRKIINKNSVYFACNFNPNIISVKKDYFIPYSVAEKKLKDNSLLDNSKFINELDKKLRSIDNSKKIK